MAMSLPVQVAQGHNSQGDPNISLRTLIRSEFFPSQSHDMTGKTIFPFFFDGSLRHWLQAFVFVFVTWGKPIHLDILPDNAPGSVKIRPTTVWRSRDATVWRSRDGITGSAELQRNLCFCRGTIFAEIKGLQQDGIPNCVRTGIWTVSVQAVLGAWGYVKNPSATLTCISPSPSVTFWDTSMTQTLNNQSQLCQLTHVSSPASRWIRLFEKATGWSRMLEPTLWFHVWFHGLHREYSKACGGFRLIPDQPKS